MDRTTARDWAYEEFGHAELGDRRRTSRLVLASIQQATAMRSSEEPFVYVVVDGTSLRLTDRQLTKDFGAVGSTANAARGLKLVHLTCSAFFGPRQA